MSTLNLTDKLIDFPAQYNNDIQSINDELHFKQDGSPSNIKYTGTANISGNLTVTGDISGSFKGTIEASNVLLDGGGNVETEFATITNLNNSILDQARDFERRAEMIRKVTPSGFTKVGTSDTPLSDYPGLYRGNFGESWLTNYPLAIGTGLDGDDTRVIVNGYEIRIGGLSVDGGADVIQGIQMLAPPTTGTRQDLVFIEAWKEEVDKETGLFFPLGNTQYRVSTAIDGTNLSQVQAGFTGSAYFTSNNGVYCVRANSITEAFIANTDNNIGILDNGNYFQIRYRIRVEADILVPSYENIMCGSGGNSTEAIRPQGQRASVPSRGNWNDGLGITGTFFNQAAIGANQFYRVDDKGILLGAASAGGVLQDVSLDGFTYAIPICAIHSRNTGVYSLENQNGTAFENAWIVELTNFVAIAPHGQFAQTLVTSNGSVFMVVEKSSSVKEMVKLVRVSGNTAPSGTASWSTEFGVVTNEPLFSVVVDNGTLLPGVLNAGTINARPDSLYSDIIDRRDVLDLRHKVSLKGDFDTDALYQETVDLLMKGEYRQEWETQKAYDADGNGLATIETGIYGNVLLETLGLGATVPDAHINQHITKQLTCNNGTPAIFNGARTVFSDKENNEDYTALIGDHTSPQVFDSEDGIITYNGISKTITIDMTQHSSYVNDVTKDPTLLSGHTPSIKWGNGADVAGVLTRNSDYNWSFEVKQYGAVYLPSTSSYSFHEGDIYVDANGNQWLAVSTAVSQDPHYLPNYVDGNTGSVLPTVGTTMTKVSGLGPDTYTLLAGISYHPYNVFYPTGYSNTAHATDPNEAIFATFKINYKAGSSCLPELPYGGEEVIKGAEVFLDGTKLNMSNDVRCIGYQDASTKTATLLGFAEKRAVVDLGDLGTGYNNVQASSPSLVYTGGQYVMFYTGNTGKELIFRATSSDGKHFENHQMVLDLGADTEFDDTHAGHPQVILDGATWKMWYGGHDGTNWSVGYATSTDGISWTKQGQVITTTFFGGSSTHVIPSAIVKSGSTYYLYCSVFSLQTTNWWVPALATSTDGINWTSQGQIYQASQSSNYWNFAGVNFLSVIKDGSVWKALVCGRDGNPYELEGITEQESRHKYMISSDGKNWQIAGNWVSERHDGGFDNFRIGGGAGACASLIKVDNRYEVFYSGSDESNYRIGKMYLAMSQEGATGSSTTGEYTNTSPQVNLGFNSGDTVVLHYERLATQTLSEATIGNLDLKDGYIAKLGTNIGSIGLLPYVVQYPANAYGRYDNYYSALDVDILEGVDALGVTKHNDKLYLFDLKELVPSTSYQNIAYGFKDKYFNNTVFGFTTTLVQKSSSDTLSNTNTFILAGQRAGSLGLLSENSGEIKFYISAEHYTEQSDRALVNVIGNQVTILSTVGRPLVK